MKKIKFLCTIVNFVFQWLNEKHKKALYEALEKVKAGSSYQSIPAYRDLASTVLYVGTARAVHVPINHRTGMYRPYRAVQGGMENLDSNNPFPTVQNANFELFLTSTLSYLQGKGPLISMNGLHQLHVFIFFLAVFHVASSALTMTLGRAKVVGT
ncbi:hypothetical protein GW17_00017065 [Ensete ventricosum]|nr:hypothetical protein GW17_00017065 [Ensete ventricosum]